MIYVEKKSTWNYLRIFLYHPVLDQQIPEPTYELQVNEDQVWGMLRKVAFTENSIVVTLEVTNGSIQAIELMKEVPASSPNYQVAQERIGQYQKNLD